MKGSYVLRKVLTTVVATSAALIVAAPVASASTTHKWGPVKETGVTASGTWKKDWDKYDRKYWTHVHGTVKDTANDKKWVSVKYAITWYIRPGKGTPSTGITMVMGGKGDHKSFDIYEGKFQGVFETVKVSVCRQPKSCTKPKVIYSIR